MEKQRGNTPYNKTTVAILLALIVLFIIGIVIRRDYIKKEVTDVFRNRFSTQENVTDTLR